MATKRMFSNLVIDTDAFLDMPLSAQALYFHLNMKADDDGFVANAKMIQRCIGASEDDLKLLILKRFLITFDDGVLVIKHWRMHNTLRKDRYVPTNYIEDLQMLEVKENGAYTTTETSGNRLATSWQPMCDEPVPEPLPSCAIDKNRLDKNRLDKNTSCPEPLENDSVQDFADVSPIVLSNGKDFIADKKFVDEMEKAYPAVDIQMEFRKMNAWCISNPSNRKTSRGIKKFINGWLGRAQDNASKYKSKNVVPAYIENDVTTDNTPLSAEEQESLKAMLERNS